jgi:tetratricopeptide (TPR) repeat protein
MMPGQHIDGRFEIEREAGEGGMGTVFRARDRETGMPVAVKVLLDSGVHDVERFAREVQVLAELQHPSVVRYVAHGATDGGEPYLAMEWLDGEDLSQRLSRSPLSIPESVELVQLLAEALSGVHARGVIHRDIKPSNVFLCDGRVDQVKLIDFGIARMRYVTRRATRTNMAMGTPGYMAPEQARGDRDVDARADVFSLGCVLFECLTGRAAFAGEHVMAVLAKVLLEEAPRVSEICTDVPTALDRLVARMLSKEPERRPADAAAVVAELCVLGALEGDTMSDRAPTSVTPALTRGEQRLVSVLLVGADRGAPPESDPRSCAATTECVVDAAVTTRVVPEDRGEVDEAVRAVVAEHGGQFDRLADGTRVVTLMGAGAATDQAVRAARCALAVRAVLHGQAMALATGRGRMGGRWPVGEAIDRAARLLWIAEERADAAGPVSGVIVRPLPIDELTAGLLDARFDVTLLPNGGLLRGERDSVEGARTLLGKLTSCVGRERELRALEELFDECASEQVARVVLVTAPAGVGKSRLRYEFEQRVRARNSAVEIWVARGDPMRAGAPFGLLGQAIRRAARFTDAEPLVARQQKLRARVARHVDIHQRARITEFLGELVGTPVPDHERVQIRAARQDAMMLADQMRRAWVDFLEAECRAQPVLLVLEDLHWGDQPTVEFIDAALRMLREQPLMVLALARPEVRDPFPALWGDRGMTEMRLGELSRRACEKLVLEVLGDTVGSQTIAMLVERSAGNAFFLEELLRAVAEGRGGDVPGTVLAMVQSRLEGLEPESRRVLRAGSVFGQVFCRGAAATLLGESSRLATLDERFAALEKREWIARRPEATFRGETEYVFRHALVREAAYGMLTDADRALGHRLAGEWLAQAGESDAMVLAEHFDRGSEPAQAMGWYLRAAEQALEGNDLAAAIGRVERSVACGATGEMLGELHLIRAEAHGWRGEFAEAEKWAMEAMRTLPKGGAQWYSAMSEVAGAAIQLGHHEQLATLAEVLDMSGAAEGDAQVVPIAQTGAQLYIAGRSCNELGAYAKAVKLLRAALTEAERIGLQFVAAMARHDLGSALARLGSIDEARIVEAQAVEDFIAHGDERLEGSSRAYLAAVFRLEGDLEAAEAEARRAVHVLVDTPAQLPHALATLADILLEQGNVTESLEVAGRAIDLLESLGQVEEGEALARLVYAEALGASGERAAARSAIVLARDRLLARAGKIADPASRASFLERVHEHARTMTVARTWTDDATGSRPSEASTYVV